MWGRKYSSTQQLLNTSTCKQGRYKTVAKGGSSRRLTKVEKPKKKKAAPAESLNLLNKSLKKK